MKDGKNIKLFFIMNDIEKVVRVENIGAKTKGRANILHVAPSQGKWSVRSDASIRARNIYETKHEAVASAQKTLTKNVKIVVVHGKDGRVDYIISKDGRRL